MKKLLLLLVILDLAGQNWAQDSLVTIKLDFKTKRFYGLKALGNLKKGDYFQLKIDSINMNLYKIVFNKKDTTIASNLTFPTFDLAILGGVGDLLSKVNISSTTISNLLSGTNYEISNFKSYLQKQSFMDEQLAFKPDKMSNNDFKELEKQLKASNNYNNETIKKTIETRIIKEKSSIMSKESFLKSFQTEIDTLQLNIQKKIYSYFVLDKSFINYQRLSGDLSLNNILLQTDLLRTNLKLFSQSITTLHNEYKIFMSNDDFKKIINDDKNKELKEADNNLTDAFLKIISNADKLYESVNSEKVAAWIKELIFKDNNSIFSYTTLPQQLIEDQTKLNIQLIPAEKEYGLPNYQTEIQFPQKREFYVGVGMSFYYAGFKNDVFSTKATVINDSIKNYKIVDEKNKKGELGLATLIYFGWRPFHDKDANWFGLNLVTGPAFSLTNTVKPRLALGAGLSFGRKNMLTINGMYMGGYVEKKSELFNAGEIYSSNPTNISVSKLEGSLGISLGYIYKF